MNDKATQLAMRHKQRDYLEAIKPFVSIKAEIYLATMPTMIIHPDGRAEYQHDFTPEQKEALRLADEAIEHTRVLVFGA
jgi:hypothetical protein